MVNLRSLLSFLPLLNDEHRAKRQAGPSSSINGGPHYAYAGTIYGEPLPTTGPSYAPLKPATTRCYRPGSCVEFAYPAVILEPGARILQAVCPSDDEIIITFADHAAFVTAQSWPMANLVLIGQGYPGCGPLGSADTRFYAITESAVTDANSRSITAQIVYVTNDQVIISGSVGSVSSSFVTTTFTRVETVSNEGLTTTIPITVTDTLTVYPSPTSYTSFESTGPVTSTSTSELFVISESSTLVSSSTATDTDSSAVESQIESSTKPPSRTTSLPSSPAASSIIPPAPTSTVSCLSDDDGFYTDRTGITYEPQCNRWIRGDVVATFGPRYTAERCLESCSMVFPGCNYAVFSKSEGGYCTLIGAGASQWQVLFGYDTYERVTMHVGTNSSSDSSTSESDLVASIPASSSGPASPVETSDLSSSGTSGAMSTESAASPSETGGSTYFPSIWPPFPVASESSTGSTAIPPPWPFGRQSTTELATETSVPPPWNFGSDTSTETAITQPPWAFATESSTGLDTVSPTTTFHGMAPTAGLPACTPMVIPSILDVTCPLKNNSVVFDLAAHRHYEIGCDFMAGAVDGRFYQAQNIVECADQCTGACDAFHFGFGECELYTSVTAWSSYPGYTVGAVVPSPTQGPCTTKPGEESPTSPTPFPASSGAVTSTPSGVIPGAPYSTTPSPGLASSTVTPSTGSPCPAFNGSIYVDANGQTYETYCGYHLAGPMLNVWFYIDTDELCMEQCDQTDGCIGAVHDSNYPDVCVLSSSQYPNTPGFAPGPMLGPVLAPIIAGVSSRDAFVLVQTTSSLPSSMTPPYPSSTSLPSPNSSLSSGINCAVSQNAVYTDPTNQRVYEVHCGSLLSSPGTYHWTQFRTVRGKYSFAACASQCNSTTCPGFVYSGQSNACGLYNAAVDGAASASISGAPSMTLAKAVGWAPSSASPSYPAWPPSSAAAMSSITAMPSSQLVPSETSSTVSIASSSSEVSSTSLSSKTYTWLTSTSSSPVSTPSSLCPASDGSTITDRTGARYSVTCNIDMPGGDFGISISPVYGLATDQDCLAKCDETPGCVGIVFASTTCSNNWCHCFLKDSIAPSVANSYYNSYVRIPDAGNGSSAVISTSSMSSVLAQSSSFSLTSSESASLMATSSSESGQPSTFSTYSQTSSTSTPSDTSSSITYSSSLISSYTPSSALAQSSSLTGTSSTGKSWITATSTTTKTSSTAISSTSSSSTSSSTSSAPSPSVSPASLPLQCPGSNGTVFTATADRAQFQIMCYMDLAKNAPDYGVSVQPSMEACIDACDRLGPSGCQGVSWVPQGQPQTYCYYKPAADQYVPQPGGVTVWSAKIVGYAK